jgi:hypothetical protein
MQVRPGAGVEAGCSFPTAASHLLVAMHWIQRRATPITGKCSCEQLLHAFVMLLTWPPCCPALCCVAGVQVFPMLLTLSQQSQHATRS